VTTIYFVDALAGSGKTHAATRHAHWLAQRGDKVLIVQPSVKLIQQTFTDLAALSPEVPVRAIYGSGPHGTGTSSNVVGDIVRHSIDTRPEGEVLLVTHAAFLRLPFFHRRDHWHLLIDEIPQADWSDELNLANTHHILTDRLVAETDESGLVGNRYARITPKDRGRLEAMLLNKNGDEVWDRFHDLLGKLLSPHWRTYVLDDQYCDLIDGNGDRRSLLTFAVLHPSLIEGFIAPTIMGACFTESTLYHLWRAQGVAFRPHHRIHKSLRYNQHANGHLLTIRHASDEDWSKTLRDKPLMMTAETDSGGEPRTVLESVVESIATTFAGTPFVWMGNKDLPDNLFKGQGDRLPNSPHGLNRYQGFHNVAVLSALNPPPAHFAFLAALGLDPAEVKRACYWQAVYQAVMRISMRNPDDPTPKTVIVMDRATVDWLACLFPGCSTAPLGGVVGLPTKGKSGRPRKHLCDADRKAAHRDRFKLELGVELDLVNGAAWTTDRLAFLAQDLRQRMSEFGRGRDQTLTAMGRADMSAMAGTVFTSIFTATPFDYMPLDDVETFIDGLRHFHSTELPSKEDNGLISPAIFDPALSEETKRGLDNIRAVWGVWLDNDGGDLSPEEFARLFPRLRMAIFNSYSSTRAQPRWRVFIPTTFAMSVGAYKAIVGQIMLTVNEAGYWSQQQLANGRTRKSPRHHGFDMSKLVPSSLFYLPCQAKEPSDSFFTDHSDKRRAPLDPYQWAKFAANRARPEPEIVPVTMPTPLVPTARETGITLSPAMQALRDGLQVEQETTQRNWQAEKREAAIAAWRSAPKGEGNRAFFTLGSTLARLGLSHTEIRAILWQEAAYAHSPVERRQQIKSILRKLDQRSFKAAA
jgi:hypothetical protein